MASRGATIFINGHIARSRSDGHDPSHLGDAWTNLERPISIKSRSPSDGQDDSRKNSTIVVRSNCDRGAIELRSRRDRAAIVDLSSRNHLHNHQTTFIGESRSRSWPDRGSIVARSRRDRGPIVGLFEAKFKPIHRGFEATMPLNGNRLRDASLPRRRPRQLPTIFGLILPLKAMYFSLVLQLLIDS